MPGAWISPRLRPPNGVGAGDRLEPVEDLGREELDPRRAVGRLGAREDAQRVADIVVVPYDALADAPLHRHRDRRDRQVALLRIGDRVRAELDAPALRRRVGRECQRPGNDRRPDRTSRPDPPHRITPFRRWKQRTGSRTRAATM
jgi:hypothetical protein